MKGTIEGLNILVDEDGASHYGKLVVDDDGIVRFQSDDQEEVAAAPQGSRPDTEEVGTPEA